MIMHGIIGAAVVAVAYSMLKHALPEPEKKCYSLVEQAKQTIDREKFHKITMGILMVISFIIFASI